MNLSIVFLNFCIICTIVYILHCLSKINRPWLQLVCKNEKFENYYYTHIASTRFNQTVVVHGFKRKVQFSTIFQTIKIKMMGL